MLHGRGSGCKWRAAFPGRPSPLWVILAQFGGIGRVTRGVVSADMRCAAAWNKRQMASNLCGMEVGTPKEPRVGRDGLGWEPDKRDWRARGRARSGYIRRLV